MITGIILASGFSRRMNEDKLMLDVGGMPIVERVIRAARFSRIDEVVLVYRKDEVKEIGKKYAIEAVYNERAGEGQSVAVKLGVEYAHPDTDGFMFLVGDQPFLDSATVNRLIDIFEREKHPIVVPVYKGKRGNPVVFSAQLKEDLLRIEGDAGGRLIIERMKERVRFVSMEGSIAGMTVDGRGDYESIRRLAGLCADG